MFSIKYIDSLARWCEIWQCVVASYRCQTGHEESSTRTFSELPLSDTCQCIMHALYRVYETVCVLYPNVGKTVANGK
jgi:hypothetical protein